MNEVDVGVAPFCPICLAAIRAMAPDTPILNGGWLKTKITGEYRTLTGISGLMVGAADLARRNLPPSTEPAPRQRNH